MIFSNLGVSNYEVKDVMRYSDPTSVHTETEKEHARVETRTVSIFPAARMEDKDVLSRWPGIRTLVRIETSTVHVSVDGKEEGQTRYYISGEDFPSAVYYGALARGHWAVENGCTVEEVITEVGSGIQLDRPGLSEVMRAVQEKRMDALVVRKLDRLARRSTDAYHLIELLKENGIDLICTDENLTPDLFVTRF